MSGNIMSVSFRRKKGVAWRLKGRFLPQSSLFGDFGTISSRRRIDPCRITQVSFFALAGLYVCPATVENAPRIQAAARSFNPVGTL
jgi:hypothetical protein